MIFDGSDVGVTGNVDAFYFESDGSILLSLSSDATLPDAGAVTDADILRFTPTQLGDTTAGSFALLLDGSDVGLDMSNEDIDVIGRTADGKLFVSTTSDPLIPGVSGKRSDLFVFTPTSLGDTTSGSWSLLFDASDVGLGDRLDVVLNENVDAAWLDVATGNLYLTVAGDFTTGAGLGGDRDDIFLCGSAILSEATSCSYAFYWNGAEHGFSGEDIDGLAMAGPLLPPPAAVTVPNVITDTVIHLNSQNGAVDGLAFTSSDLLTYDTAAGAWSFYFEGSSAGITQTVDGFFLESDGSLLLSLGAEQSLPGLGLVDDSDIVRFTPASLGVPTSGVFTMVLDASDVGLDNSNENIDAIGRAPDGRLLVSVSGSFSAGVIGGDEDLFVFSATQLGDATAGSWAMYFDGSDIGLATGTSEDIDGIWVDPNTGYLYLGTIGDFAAGVGFGGDKNDVFVCAPGSLGSETSCTLALFWDGGAHGLIDGNLRGFSLVPAASMTGAQTQPAMLPPKPVAANSSMFLPYITTPQE